MKVLYEPGWVEIRDIKMADIRAAHAATTNVFMCKKV